MRDTDTSPTPPPLSCGCRGHFYLCFIYYIFRSCHGWRQQPSWGKLYEHQSKSFLWRYAQILLNFHRGLASGCPGCPAQIKTSTTLPPLVVWRVEREHKGRPQFCQQGPLNQNLPFVASHMPKHNLGSAICFFHFQLVCGSD